MCDYADHVARDRVDDGQAVHAILGKHLHGVEERVVRSQEDKRSPILFEHLTPRVDLVLLELLDLGMHRLVVLLQYEYEVGDGEHADKLVLLAVPQRRRSHAIIDERVECFFHLAKFNTIQRNMFSFFFSILNSLMVD